MLEGDEKCTQNVLSEYLKSRMLSEDLGMGGMITLQWILGK
jgi:hypothetical protein